MADSRASRLALEGASTHGKFYAEARHANGVASRRRLAGMDRLAAGQETSTSHTNKSERLSPFTSWAVR